MSNATINMYKKGPCDSDEHCPAQLYCVHGDCWSLDTERALRHKQRDATGTQLEHDTVGRGKSPHASAMVKAGQFVGVNYGKIEYNKCFVSYTNVYI